MAPRIYGPGGAATLDSGDPPLTVVDCSFRLKAVSPLARFIRCDPNDDRKIDLSDAIWILSELFRGGATTRCPAAADCDGDGSRDLADGVYAIFYQLLGGSAPPTPFPECDRVPGMDPADCPFGSTSCPVE